MKIVHLCLSCFYIDNYSYQENLLPKYHVMMGHEVTVIASLLSFNKEGKHCYLSGPSVKRDENGYKVVRLDYQRPYKINKIFRKYKNLYNTLLEEKPDIIFTHGIAFGDTGTIVKYLKEHKQVKLFGDHHGDYINSATNFLSKNILHKIIWRYYIDKLKPYLIKCYGVTPMRCRFLKEMYKIDPKIIEFLPMGVDDTAIPKNREAIKELIRHELNIGDKDFVVITGGKIDERKNTHILLKALSSLDNKHVHLIICGTLTPEMEYLKDHFTPNIHYLGWCNAERVMNCMVAADLACFPGTHSTLWEQAVGVGLPSIFKHWNEMTHVNMDNNCIFVKGNDENELEEVIKKLVFTEQYYTMKSQAEKTSKEFLYSIIAAKSIQQS